MSISELLRKFDIQLFFKQYLYGLLNKQNAMCPFCQGGGGGGLKP